MRSLRRQLTAGLLLAFALLLSGGGALVYWAVRESLYDQFDAALKAKALVVMTDTRITDGRVRVSFSDRFLREFDDAVATEFFQVFDAKGQTVERSDSLGERKLPGTLRGPIDAPVYWNLTLPNGEKGRAIGIVFQPLVRRQASQDVTVVVAVSRRHVGETLLNLRNIIAGCGVALLGLTAAVVSWVLRRGLRPLDDVGGRIALIDAGSLGQRFPLEKMPSELQPVGRKLNDLLARLEASFERERRFSADLAHELRTPLAELRSLAELALTWPANREPGTDQTVLDITLQMEALVARLLAISRAEPGRESLPRAAVNVAATVENVLQPLARAIAAAELTIERTVPVDATLLTDAVLFESIVANLVGNAVAYSGRGQPVRVTFSKGGGNFEFKVMNAAPDLRAEDLTKMFDRFWRKDQARTGANHAGLGLALSRSFADVLGWELAATLADGNVLVMTLRGPA
ncbi:MAG TPA: ATP-binding protein [Opitutaceae bacterium]|nr:ATP-binding protein [Opitutaceae bacterium]